jgi:nucleoside-triphosphatase
MSSPIFYGATGRPIPLGPIKVLLSGRPGIGKSTVFMKVVEGLKRAGYSVCGFYCPEIRVGGARKGFKIVSLGLSMEGVLSYVCGEMSGLSNLTVGRYCIKVDDALSVGLKSLEFAERVCDVIAIDEVGPMELKVKELGEKIWEIMYSTKPTVAVVHIRSFDEVRRALLSRSLQVLPYVVTEANRNALHEEIVRTITSRGR